MYMQYLVYVREETETVEGDVPSPERVVYPVQSRMQLFRIVSVERDAAEREVRVTARHIFYDLLGNVVKNEYAPEGAAANAVVGQLFERALNPHDFDVHCQSTKAVTGEYTRTTAWLRRRERGWCGITLTSGFCRTRRGRRA